MRSLGLETWKAPEAMKSTWSVLTRPYFVVTVEPSTIRIAAQVNGDVENIGARRLHTILTTLLEETLFDLPDGLTTESVVVDAALVQKRLGDIATNRDLSQYIL